MGLSREPHSEPFSACVTVLVNSACETRSGVARLLCSMVQLEHARGLQAHSMSVSLVRWGSGWRWGLVRQVEVKATDLLVLFDAVAVHVLTWSKVHRCMLN